MSSQDEYRKRLKVLMNRPENQVCSDCPERQPRWASLIVPPPGAPPGTLPIGAFCCLECSGSHRRLGVHISFVRSVNLDSWKEKEVLAMENGGNRKVNTIFEARMPQGFMKPQSGADGPTRERFIRDKYERRKFYDPAGFDTYVPDDDDAEDDARSRYSSSVRSTRTTPPIRPPSDAARLRVENKQAQLGQQTPTQTRVVMERRGSERSRLPKAPRSAPASFDLLDLSAPPTIVAPAQETNFIQPSSPKESLLPSPRTRAPSPRKSYAADLLAPVPAAQSNSNSNNSSTKNSHDEIMSLFNSPPPQQTAMMGGTLPTGDFNPLMVNPNMILAQQQRHAAMMNMMVQPQSNMMALMQQQHQQQRMLHERMIQEQQQQQQLQAAAAAAAGFGANVMVQPKATPQENAMRGYQNSFHQSFIFSNDGYDNGYGVHQNNNNNAMGYGNNQLLNPMNNMTQQQQQQQSYPGMLMSSSLHGGSNGGVGGGMGGGGGGISLSSSLDDGGGGFPSTPMGGTVMASSGPLVSGMHRPMTHSPPSDLPPKPPRKEDPFAQFGMNVFRS